jgi:hypothetical protein
VKDGDTCQSIRKAHQLRFGQLIYYNPTVNQDCSNLIVGDSICVTPPGGLPVLRVVPENPKAALTGIGSEGVVNTTEGIGHNETASD